MSVARQTADHTADLTNERSINEALRHMTNPSQNPLYSSGPFKFHLGMLTLLLTAKDFAGFEGAFVLAFAQQHLHN